MKLKGIPKLDSSGKGIRANKGRGGCNPPRNKGIKIKRLNSSKKFGGDKMEGPEGIKKIANKTPALADQIKFNEFREREVKRMKARGSMKFG